MIGGAVLEDDDEFCRCEGQDHQMAGYYCDECRCEIPAAMIISDFSGGER